MLDPQRPRDTPLPPSAPPRPLRGQTVPAFWPLSQKIRWPTLGLIGLHKEPKGSSQSSPPPPECTPHAPTRPTSFSSRRNSSSWPVAGGGTLQGALCSGRAGAGEGSPQFGSCLGAWPAQKTAGFPRRTAPSLLLLPPERIYVQDLKPGRIGQFNNQRELILTRSLRKMMVCGTILCRAGIAEKKRNQTPTARAGGGTDSKRTRTESVEKRGNTDLR